MELSLTDQQIGLIRRSWAEVAANAPMAAELFYGRLFRIAPDARRLFVNDMTLQGRKLTQTLGFVVDQLDRPGPLIAAAEALAVRHVRYGVVAADYRPVGEALIWAFSHILGSRFDEPTREAWTLAYAELERLMIAAAYPGGAEAEPVG